MDGCVHDNAAGLGDSMVCLPPAQYASMHSSARIRINGRLLWMPRRQASLRQGVVLKHKPSSERNCSSAEGQFYEWISLEEDNCAKRGGCNIY